MKIHYALLLTLLLVVLHLSGMAQVGRSQMQQAPRWTVEVKPAQVPVGGEAELIIRAQIPKDWYLYSTDFDPELGPTVTEFSFTPHASYSLLGKVQPVGAKRKYDDLWEGEYTYFTGTAEFRQKIKVLQENPKIQATVSYQICSDVSGQCIPFDSDLPTPNLQVVKAKEGQQQTGETITPPKQGKKEPQEKTGYQRDGGNASITSPEEESGSESAGESGLATTEQQQVFVPADRSGAAEEAETATQTQAAGSEAVTVRQYDPFQNPFGEETGDESRSGFLALFLISLAAGITALLTPCIYPMIPLTVTYFLKMGQGNRRKGVMFALFYGISIVLIYLSLGILFAKIFGADYANELSTHWFPNILFFFIFILFALSFFGLFDITLPNSFINKVDRQADRGGLVGVFFMAFALVLIGFSCTGPIVGTILIETADEIGVKSVVSMLGFSLAFALPFTLLAIFPGWLNSLPKSGGWLNSVKVVLGFLELALALKFLSVADQTYHWGLLDREVYLALWIIIFTLMGFYLLGKIRLPHDSPRTSTSITGLILAILTFGFVLYLIPGMFGAPLKALAGYLPPMSTHDFNLVAILKGEEKSELPQLCEKPRYDELLHLPHGLSGYFDYEQALACARAQNKPLFIDFTGHGCVNCREMEANVWSDPEVLRRLREDYVVVALYVDEKKELPAEDWYVSAYDGKLKKSIGKQNLDFMIQRLNANAQPYYTLVDPHTETLLAAPKAYDLEVKNFVDFLEAGVARLRQAPLAQQ
ncbi:thiol:disulfide interchange protein [Flammeovirgaceae bacterium 311]|nr:thiol:disulfide interchange protein [Flammeovirgaceae bacterium 311]